MREGIESDKVTGKTGRATSFEITVNDTVIFSKLKSKRFPDNEAVLEEIRSIMNGNDPKLVEKLDESWCSIL